MEHQSSIATHLVMFGWIPAVLLLFALVPARRAIIAAFVGGWLFLPMTAYQIEGLPDYTKVTAPAIAILVAAVLFNPGRLLAFRPRVWDLPMALWCLAPMASSLANGLGPYDGLSASLDQTFMWGLPYLLGRVYLTDADALRDLAIGIVIGGLVYLPLCLWEIKMSPQLHRVIYGYHQHQFIQSVRGSTYRPMVFLQHGLAVGMYMSVAALVAFALWHYRALRHIRGVPMGLIAGALVVVSLACKSALAAVLLIVGVGVLLAIRLAPSRLWLAALMLLPVLYMSARTVGGWAAANLVDAAGIFGRQRALSLASRIDSENILWRHASEQPIFGWGGWGRALVYDPGGGLVATPDGLWIIAVGENGLVGLAALTASVLVGPALLLYRFRPRDLRHPAMAAPTALGLVLALHMCDNLFNAMVNPVFVLGLGGLVAVAARGRAAVPALARRRRARPTPAPTPAPRPLRRPRPAAEGAPW